MIRSSRPDRRRPLAAGALAALPVLAGLAGLAGCAPGGQEDAAGLAAAAFLRALRDGDEDAACRALAPRARQALVSAAKAPCPQALAEAARSALPASAVRQAAVREVDVWGREARVTVRGDTLFLSRFDDGWRVTAAGCRARPSAPGYDCGIQGS
ncbi:hypothetical protein [Streptomyces sp. 7-21]|uniref:hypothetical protein n=1 Tax=Streptomyces sp. 7-21 TaxID=2802283 RepID=UPI00191D2805|nr:hypothetical protein [Streptomyces sp. 7-21]MBL1065172.1 hypothetical protein [Streptomyces sp. 7-21]